MSAIFGLCHWDEGAADPGDLMVMAERLRHRGTRSPRFWQGGATAFGHCMLVTTPEARQESLPSYWSQEKVAITADARIDNRAELIARLDCDRSAHTVADGELILLAYLKWGESCPEMLLGDFAFAIWDERQRRLFCARDHFGIKPLYYRHTPRGFAFASETRPLRALQKTACAINRQTVVDFLLGTSDGSEETYFEGISRVQPGQAVTVDGTSLRRRTYYQLDPKRELPCKNDSEYVEEFHERFTRAVERRLRTDTGVVSLLSGGLDSSSITCVAARLLQKQSSGSRLETISNVFDDLPECDEREFIQDVVRKSGCLSEYIPVTHDRSFDDLKAFNEQMDQPSAAVGMFAMGSLYPYVRRKGVNVVLDGHGGDEVVSFGYALLRELAHQSRWIALTREWLALARSQEAGEMGLRNLGKAIMSYGVIGQMRARLRLRSRFSHGLPVVPGRPDWADHLDPALIAEMQLARRHSEWRATQPGTATNERQAHFHLLSPNTQSLAFEDLDRVAARDAVEPRYPFWDKELVEFCLALPGEKKLSHGQTRWILRAGMKGELPESVRVRHGKAGFNAHVLRCLRQIDPEHLRGLINGSDGLLGPLISKNWCNEVLDKLVSEENIAGDKLFSFWRCIIAKTWLKGADTFQTEV